MEGDKLAIEREFLYYQNRIGDYLRDKVSSSSSPSSSASASGLSAAGPFLVVPTSSGSASASGSSAAGPSLVVPASSGSADLASLLSSPPSSVVEVLIKESLEVSPGFLVGSPVNSVPVDEGIAAVAVLHTIEGRSSTSEGSSSASFPFLVDRQAVPPLLLLRRRQSLPLGWTPVWPRAFCADIVGTGTTGAPLRRPIGFLLSLLM
jgi:hypothetical protein